MEVKGDEIPDLMDKESVISPQWCGIFSCDVDFSQEHFEKAMNNLIRQPNINSTVILRADILKDQQFNSEGDLTEDYSNEEMINSMPNIQDTSDQPILCRNLSDVDIREIPILLPLKASTKIVRRMVPRNPFKDYIINQTCLVSKNDKSTLVTYIPHISSADDCPFYLPPVYAVGILFHEGRLSLHYLPFEYNNSENLTALKQLSPQDRPIRILYRLLKTASKHSTGVMNGYKKRVQHDQVVSKVLFQDRYIALKRKYWKHFCENWVESTDPKKHVFEDLAILAFLIEYWSQIYPNKECFEFRDLGCGNGLLVHILISEGYRGVGIDARRRKSWKIYPSEVQNLLKEQVIIPSILLRPHPLYKSMIPHLQDNGRIFQIPISNGHNNNDKNKPQLPIAVDNLPIMAYYSSASLLSSPQVNTAEFPSNTFIIGNHSDELTCWIPLLGYPFMVIPCCSHSLGGSRVRYTSPSQPHSSTYAALCDKVKMLSTLVGWNIKTEMLRIPSTRNMLIIGFEKLDPLQHQIYSVYDVLAMEGGGERWVENTMALMKKTPRDH